jgi:hypothetical protein
MGIKVAWDTEEQKAICLVFDKPWTWDDFENANNEMTALLNSVQYKVDIIFDISRAGFPPSGALQRFKKVAQNYHQNTRHLVYVGGKEFVMNFLKLMVVIYGKAFQPPNFTFTSSVAEAREVIHKKTSPATEVKVQL